MFPRRFSDAEEGVILAAYRNGQSMRAIADAKGCDCDTVVRAIRRRGGSARTRSEARRDGTGNVERRKTTAARAKESAAMYDSGMSAQAIADVQGLSPVGVHASLRRIGHQLRSPSEAHRKYSLNESAFDDVSGSEAGRYLVGFLMADGYVCHPRCNNSSPTVGLSVNPRDAWVIDLLRNFIGSTQPARLIPGHTRQGSFARTPLLRFEFRSARITEALARYGIGPRKTFTAKVCPALQHDPAFWRGAIDGDGSVMMPLNRGFPMPAVMLCGSHSLVTQFVNYAAHISPLCKATVRRPASIHVAVVSGGHARRLVEAVYGASPIALPRKVEVARRIMLWQPKRAPR